MTTSIQHQRRAGRRKVVPPLENGDHLDQKTFHERYEAMPEHVRAELIGGIVYMSSSPLHPRHARADSDVTLWLGLYRVATPNTDNMANATTILGDDSEPQPDGCLYIYPQNGGQVWFDKDGYLCGAPEFLSETSSSMESIDLNAKKADYEKAGVREYLVAAMRRQQVYWFVRQRGKFREMKPDMDGIYRSRVFPGLWLDPVALLKRETERLLAVLRQGLASPEHMAFVAKLAARGPKGTRQSN